MCVCKVIDMIIFILLLMFIFRFMLMFMSAIVSALILFRLSCNECKCMFHPNREFQ